MAVVLDTVSGARARHPEKAHRPDTVALKKPDWIRVKAPVSKGYSQTQAIVRANGLHTVCEEAGCPNIGECWEKKHATFMIMGDTCTRACAFCNVKTGLPGPLDAQRARARRGSDRQSSASRTWSSPRSTATISTTAGQRTLPTSSAPSVRSARDHDRGADAGFPAQRQARSRRWSRRGPTSSTTISKPCRRNISRVRPGARYFASIRLLQRVKEVDPAMFTKSGIMVGLGEERNEVLQVMDDLRAADVDFLTIGQYLQPTRKHHAVMRFVPPDEFKAYETIAYAKGFLMVSASPLTRSSHHAGEDFAQLKAARQARLR